MCGRFVRKSSIMEIADEFSVNPLSADIVPDYNIAPGKDILNIIDDGRRRLVQCRWGFIPSWTEDPSTGYKMINARAESVSEKPSFRDAFRKSRSLIVADGFYEWQKRGNSKIPLYVTLKAGSPFGMAGLFNYWAPPKGTDICTCTIVTTVANELLRSVHERMPAIIPKNQWNLWLNPEVHDKSVLLALMKPYNADGMVAYEVSSSVNSPACNVPENIKPAEKSLPY